MFSVTKRVEQVRQPKFGYLPLDMLTVQIYNDRQKIIDIDSGYRAIQGMAVDYLTRYLNGSPKHIAFQISLMGAEKVGELENAKSLLEKINGLNASSICAACQLVGYDVAQRRGPVFFSPVERIKPDEQMIENIIIMVKRCLAFLKKNGPVVLDGFTFEGGYNEMISTGDGDYLTADTLWDFKASNSKPETSHTLQILVYYIMGIHSIHPEFQNIQKLGIFNPELNRSYTVSLSDISDETFQAVSRDVIGYRTSMDAENWRMASGTSKKAIEELISRFSDYFTDTGFSPDNYDDGIHNISIDDYWSYLKKITNHPKRPDFSRTHSIKFIKHSGYFMFVSFSTKGEPSILQGGAIRRLHHKSVRYYYNRLPEYANLVLQNFSSYWDALYSLSKQIRSITDEDHNSPFSGKVHGCIVDIDFMNHIFLNPSDGTIVPYFAESTDMKYVYQNVYSLIATERPEMLPALNQAIEKSTDKESTALVTADSRKALSILEKSEINPHCEFVADTSMYAISNRIKLLQPVYDHHLVVAWYDHILPPYDPCEKSKLPQVSNTCTILETVLSDIDYKSIDLQTEDEIL